MENLDNLGRYFVSAAVVSIMPVGILIGGLALANYLDEASAYIDMESERLIGTGLSIIGMLATLAVFVSAVAIIWLSWRVIRNVRLTLRETTSRSYAFNSDKSLRTSSA